MAETTWTYSGFFKRKWAPVFLPPSALLLIAITLTIVFSQPTVLTAIGISGLLGAVFPLWGLILLAGFIASAAVFTTFFFHFRANDQLQIQKKDLKELEEKKEEKKTPETYEDLLDALSQEKKQEYVDLITKLESKKPELKALVKKADKKGIEKKFDECLEIVASLPINYPGIDTFIKDFGGKELLKLAREYKVTPPVMAGLAKLQKTQNITSNTTGLTVSQTHFIVTTPEAKATRILTLEMDKLLKIVQKPKPEKTNLIKQKSTDIEVQYAKCTTQLKQLPTSHAAHKEFTAFQKTLLEAARKTECTRDVVTNSAAAKKAAKQIN